MQEAEGKISKPNHSLRSVSGAETQNREGEAPAEPHSFRKIRQQPSNA